MVVDIRSVFGFDGKKDKGYQVKVACGKQSTMSNKVVVSADQTLENGVLHVFQRLSLNFAFEGPVTELADVFVYLVAGEKPVSFIRIPANDLRVNHSLFRDEQLTVESCQNQDLKYHQAGFINFRIAINSDADWQSLQYASPQPASAFAVPWSQAPRQDRSRTSRVTIIANLYMGRRFISADDDGLCDPVVTIYHHGASRRSDVVMDSLSPVWSQRLEINSLVMNDWLPPVVVYVDDLDQRLLLKDEIERLGISKIDLDPKEIRVNGDPSYIPELKWYDIQDETKISTAQIMMSFTLISNDPSSGSLRIPPFNVPKENFLIQMQILGLRNLQSSGLFSVKNPFIKFHTGALKASGNSKGGSVFDILTAKCKSGGPNASFSETLT